MHSEIKINKPLKVISKFEKTSQLYFAIVLGIKDFCKKNNIIKVHFGLSGGIDSALVAVLAKEALGSENVTAIALPGPFNSEESFLVAKKLSENLSLNFLKIVSVMVFR